VRSIDATGQRKPGRALYPQRVTSANPGLRTIALAGSALAASVAAGAAAFAGYRRFRHRIAENAAVLNETLPINSKWWRDQATDTGQLLYVAIGDSAAQGIGASAPSRGYVGILADRIRSVTGRTVRVVNLSVSGATVALAVRDQLPRLRKLKPDVVTVAIGANDIAMWDAAVFEAGIREILAAVPEHALVADLPCFHFPHNERKVAEANRIVRAVAAEHGLTVVPLHATTKREGLRSIATQFANDMFHPNDRGYQVWAEAFLPALGADLRRRVPPAAPTLAGRFAQVSAEEARAGAHMQLPAPAAAAADPEGVGGPS
jgi:acyl-CoA thioesterase-1